MFKWSIKLLSLFLFPISVFSYVDTVSLLKNIEHAQTGLIIYRLFHVCYSIFDGYDDTQISSLGNLWFKEKPTKTGDEWMVVLALVLAIAACGHWQDQSTDKRRSDGN